MFPYQQIKVKETFFLFWKLSKDVSLNVKSYFGVGKRHSIFGNLFNGLSPYYTPLPFALPIALMLYPTLLSDHLCMQKRTIRYIC